MRGGYDGGRGGGAVGAMVGFERGSCVAGRGGLWLGVVPAGYCAVHPRTGGPMMFPGPRAPGRPRRVVRGAQNDPGRILPSDFHASSVCSGLWDLQRVSEYVGVVAPERGVVAGGGLSVGMRDELARVVEVRSAVEWIVWFVAEWWDPLLGHDALF